MIGNGPTWPLVVLLLLVSRVAVASDDRVAERVDFRGQILPILEQNCWKCHGEEKRKGGLRLTSRAEALVSNDSGEPAIVPGRSQASTMIARVASEDDLERMPPTGHRLAEGQIQLLRAWIDQGAEWPASDGRATTHWAYAKPARPRLPRVLHGAWVENPIDRFILARLEADGLSPSPPADPARLIRRAYLDLIGLPPTVEQVDAFLRDDRPGAYDRVVDGLLASPRYGERWARSWLDLARYADSNGYQRDGFRDTWAYRDWVITALNADMPFDRFTIEQIAGDLLPDATPAQKVATGFHRGTTVNVEAGVDQEETRVNAVIDRVNTTATVWLGTTLACAQCHNHKYDPFTQADYYRLSAYFNSTLPETAFQSAKNTSALDFTGPSMELPSTPEARARREAMERRAEALEGRIEELTAEDASHQHSWESRVLGDPQSLEGLPRVIRRVLEIPVEKRTAAQKKRLSAHIQGDRPEIKAMRDDLAGIKARIETLKPPSTLVMVEMDRPRTTHLLLRGNFLEPGAVVGPGVPETLHPLPQDAPPNRLGLARWLVDPENPLVGRVQVNRWWAEFFGSGLVSSLEDFGTQGERPTHPELLDWLATEFVRRGWSTKAIHRLMVTSATYRQSSHSRPDLLDRDPGNGLYARGPRVRLDAETIRDNALAIGGLLSPRMGGPPVRPPQPEGIWRVTGNVDNNYRTSRGEDRYRRGVYVIWRRSAPYPSFVTFDAPDRSSCVVGRPRTNTPLQALTLMNDPVYVEAAWALASRIVTEGRGSDPSGRAEYGFRICLARHPRPHEAEILADVYRRERARLRSDPSAAEKLVGKVTIPEGSDAEELAAWFFVANVLLNLDETITRG
ncbi:MAG: PSD1 and planctomycete cytochrome C domain-containing protein [Singulisphaera sp.]